MRDNGTGWASLAVLVAIRILMADDAVAGDAAQRRDTAAAVTPARRIVVSIPDRKLAVIEDGRVLRVFDVAVGAPASPSPVGIFTVVNRIDRPTYYAPGKVIPPGPANPLGTRWLGLDRAGYGIHGTDRPDSIGRAKSHGCIRLRNRDVEALFPLVHTGDTVELHDQRPAEFEALLLAAHAN